MVLPSLFVKNDWKCHLSVNLDTGLWQDFKSEEKGDFISFYALTKGISRKLARAEIYINSFSTSGVDEPIKFIADDSDMAKEEFIPVSIESCDSEDQDILLAWSYAYSRGLFSLKTDKPEFFISRSKRLSGRLVIPYFEGGNMFYYQARALADQHPKYMNPEGGDIQKASLLYPFDTSLPYVVVCEGPIDAISLKNAGVNATCTCGCVPSMEQLKQLKDFDGKVIFGYDNDSAGKKGLKIADEKRRLLMMSEIYFCTPPKGYKDWNEAFVAGEPLGSYVSDYTKRYAFGSEFFWSL